MSADGGARLLVALQYLLPQHLLSRAVHWLARNRTGWLKNATVFPSGATCGDELILPSSVTCSAAEPSALIRQICVRPERDESK